MATLTCGTGGTYATLSAAIAAPPLSGDTIEIQAGNYSGAGWSNVSVNISNLIITNNGAVTITGSASQSVLLLNATGITVQGTAQANFVIKVVTGNYYGIRFNSTGATVKSLTIQCTNAVSDSYAMGCYDTVNADVEVEDVFMCGVVSTNNYGIYWGGTATGTIGTWTNCLFQNLRACWCGASDTTSDAPVFDRGSVCDCTYCGRYNRGAKWRNYVIWNTTTGFYTGNGAYIENCTIDGATTAIWGATVGGYDQIRNNIFYACTTALKGGIGAETAPDTNDYFNCGTKYTAYTPDVNELTDDPGFVDQPTHDYNLSQTSALIDAGIDIGITSDRDHAAGYRPQQGGYDLGAFEASAIGPPDPPDPPTPLATRRHEIHRVWHGNYIGDITIRGVTTGVYLTGGDYTGYDLAADLQTAAETSTGIHCHGWLSPALELVLAFGEAWAWVGTTQWNAWAGWADGAAPAYSGGGFAIVGADETMAERVCAARLSWPILHAYRSLAYRPVAEAPIVAAQLRAAVIDFQLEVWMRQTDKSRWWLAEQICYYRGTDTEWVPYYDCDGWLILRPIAAPMPLRQSMTGWAGRVIYAGDYTRIEGD